MRGNTWLLAAKRSSLLGNCATAPVCGIADRQMSSLRYLDSMLHTNAACGTEITLIRHFVYRSDVGCPTGNAPPSCPAQSLPAAIDDNCQTDVGPSAAAYRLSRTAEWCPQRPSASGWRPSSWWSALLQRVRPPSPLQIFQARSTHIDTIAASHLLTR